MPLAYMATQMTSGPESAEYAMVIDPLPLSVSESLRGADAGKLTVNVIAGGMDWAFAMNPIAALPEPLAGAVNTTVSPCWRPPMGDPWVSGNDGIHVAVPPPLAIKITAPQPAPTVIVSVSLLLMV